MMKRGCAETQGLTGACECGPGAMTFRVQAVLAMALTADVLCLQRAGDGGIVGAGDDGAAVGEDGELVGVDGEAEEEGVAG